MQLSLYSIGLWALAVSALPANLNEWKPAGSGDSRSPCPMLNTLANHGYIPRDGKSITLKALQDGFTAAINLAPDFSVGPFATGLTTSTTGNASTFDLHDLTKHNVIEHDASLSRLDTAQGDAQPFNAAVWAQTSSHFGKDIVTVEQSARARLARIETLKKTNPKFELLDGGVRAGTGEAGLFLVVMGNKVTGDAPRGFVETFFRQEKLPLQDGWKRQTEVITSADVGAMVKKIAAVTA